LARIGLGRIRRVGSPPMGVDLSCVVAGEDIVDLGAPELLIILVIVLLIFGSNKLPKLARSLGQASREFKAGTTEGWQEDRTVTPPPVRASVEPPGSSAPPPDEPTQHR